MVRVINDLNLYLDDPLLYDSFAVGADGRTNSCSSTLCELISRNKQQIQSFYKLFGASNDKEETGFGDTGDGGKKILDSIHQLFMDAITLLMSQISEKMCQTEQS